MSRTSRLFWPALTALTAGVLLSRRRPRHPQALSGRTVVITGASSGIGRATALESARRGAQVVLAARRTEQLEQVAAEIAALGAEALVVPTDVRERSQVGALCRAAVERFGRLDIFVNCAGDMFVDSVEHSEEWRVRHLIETNVMGTIYGIQSALPFMRAQGRGHLILIASAEGRVGFPYSGMYAGTKGFIELMTQSLRQELTQVERSGISVTTVLPAAVRTPLFDTAPNVKEGGHGAHLVEPVMKASQVARQVVEAMEHPRPVLYPLVAARAFVLLYDLAPGLGDLALSQLRVDRHVNFLSHKKRGT